MDTQEGEETMKHKADDDKAVLEYYNVSRGLMKKAHKQLQEQLLDQKRKYEEYFKDGTPEIKAAASVAKGLYGEIIEIHGIIHTLTENALYLKLLIVLQQKTIDTVSKKNPNNPEIKKLKSQIKSITKKITEHDEFYKFMIKQIGDKPVSKKTKPHEGMYE